LACQWLCPLWARSQPQDLRHGFTRGQAALQLGDQIGQRHIHKTAAGHDKKKWQKVMQRIDQQIAHCTTQRRYSPGQ
jgi:hypothetical protein